MSILQSICLGPKQFHLNHHFTVLVDIQGVPKDLSIEKPD